MDGRVKAEPRTGIQWVIDIEAGLLVCHPVDHPPRGHAVPQRRVMPLHGPTRCSTLVATVAMADHGVQGRADQLAREHVNEERDALPEAVPGACREASSMVSRVQPAVPQLLSETG